jgi:glycosyltransferase involved in cell wall biosynthesis
LLGNRQDIPQLLYASNLFVMSSDSEGLPIVLLEAMMTGVPVVVTDVGGCRDVVEACGAGLVVSPGDSVALANAIEFMIDNPQQANKMSACAQEKSLQYSIDVSVKSHLELYKELIE